jgi:hypothetical protein
MPLFGNYVGFLQRSPSFRQSSVPAFGWQGPGDR